MNNSNQFNTLNKKDRIDFYIALAVIISVLSFILYFSFGDFFSNNDSSIIESDSIEVQLDDTIVVKGQQYVPLLKERESRQRISNQNATENTQPVVVIDSTINESMPVHDIDNGGSEAIDNKPSIKDNSSGVPIDTISKELDKSDTVSDEVNTTKVEVPETKNTEVEDTQIPVVQKGAVDESCIIAVGLYGKKANANRMKSRLASAGYNAFISTRRTKFQVQVYHECNNVTLNNTLKDIRKDYASDAVILIKK